jgi:hypothetical protein
VRYCRRDVVSTSTNEDLSIDNCASTMKVSVDSAAAGSQVAVELTTESDSQQPTQGTAKKML